MLWIDFHKALVDIYIKPLANITVKTGLNKTIKDDRLQTFWIQVIGKKRQLMEGLNMSRQAISFTCHEKNSDGRKINAA